MTTKILKVIDLFTVQSVAFSNLTYLQAVGDKVYWDSDRYDGTVSVYFEVVAGLYSGAGTAHVALSAEDGTIVEGTEFELTTTTVNRFRSDVLTLSDDTIYKVVGHRDTQYAAVYAARLIIIQEDNITKTETRFPVAGSRRAASSPADWTTMPTSFYFIYNADNFSGTQETVFQVVSNVTGAETASFRLVDTDGNVVAGSEVSTSSTSSAVLTSSGLSLTNGLSYTVEYKYTNASSTLTNSAPCVVIRQTSVGSGAITETHYGDYAPSTGTTTSYVSLNSFLYWDNDEWSVYSKVVTAIGMLRNQNGAATSYLEFYGDSTQLVEFTETSASFVLHESSELTPTDNIVYNARAKTSNTASDCYFNYMKFKIVATITEYVPPIIATSVLLMMIEDE